MVKTVRITLFLLLIILISSGLVLANPLKGRVIVLNPGHGGHERGAIGPTGLEEQEINLKVGLYLKEMLEEAGARVYITRTTDLDLDETEHYSGTRDRFNRLRWGREKEADIFIALHHNASVNPESNQIEVYYMPNYYGPSRNLAEYVARGLSEKMGIKGVATTFSQVVVNHATIPTIIGEAGYISNPELEQKYRSDDFLRKEAEGYFEGIKAFFASGMPEVEAIYPSVNARISQSKPIIFARIIPGGESPINPSSIRVLLDKKFINFDYDEERGLIIAKLEDDLANGAHHLLIIGANQNGIMAVPLDITFYIDEKPARIVMNDFASWIPDQKEAVVKISGRVLDDDGEPVMDGNIVRFELTRGGYFQSEEVFTRNGYFVNYLHRGDFEYEIAPIRIVAGGTLEEIVVQWESRKGYLYGRVMDKEKSEPLVEVPVTLKGKAYYGTYTDFEGDYFFTDVEPGEYQLSVIKDGYEMYSSTLNIGESGIVVKDNYLEPIAGGVLRDKKIIFNLMDTNQALFDRLKEVKSLLERGGAKVIFYNSIDNDLNTIKKINKLLGDIVLNVTYSNEKEILHYPGSEEYQKLALDLASKLGIAYQVGESKNKLVTFASTTSLIIRSTEDFSVKGIYDWLVEYFAGLE